MVKGMGGAMDLVASAKNIIVAMMHTNPKGRVEIIISLYIAINGGPLCKKDRHGSCSGGCDREWLQIAGKSSRNLY